MTNDSRSTWTGARTLVRQPRERAATVALLLLLGTLALPGAARAQMLGVPVLQNAFTNPGVTVGLNYGGGGGASTIGGAAAWAPGGGRFQISAGAGSSSPGGAGKRAGTFGARLAVSLKQFAGGSIGVAPFAGVGGASVSGVSTSFVPIGVGIGYRHALGETRAFSAYATPFYALNRQNVSGGGSTSANSFRISFGLDVALLRSVGATAGVETGSAAAAGKPGATSSIFGVGLSYAF